MTDAPGWPRKTRERRGRRYDSTVWNEFAFRNDDIIVATYPKAGTTWMQQIVGQLIFGGDPDLAINQISPWLEAFPPPKAETLAQLAAQTHRRVIKTHLSVDALVFSPRARYIHVGRDGRDICWSLHSHYANYTQIYRAHINSLAGVNGPRTVLPPSDIRQYWHEWLDSDGDPELPFWDHVRTWWAIRDLPNVLLVHYARLKQDLPGQMRTIARFLDIPIDEARWEAILEYCSFDWMKGNATKCAPGSGLAWEGGASTFIHRGVNGRWSETLTPDDVAEYEAHAASELGPACAHWLATGEGTAGST